jgi:eukaryotic-like serine/threonine-protein kinase
MSEPALCPECGRGLASDAPLGLCPGCLIGMALIQPTADQLGTTDLEQDSPDPSGEPLPRWAIEGHGQVPPWAGDNSSTADTFATRSRIDTDATAPGPLVGDNPAPPGYEILEELGRGGMGVVYKARQAKLNRLVALKMILDTTDVRPGQLERFRIEGEAVARLRHPNIVQIYEVGEVGDRPYFSLELLEGGSLAARIAGAPQPARSSAELLAILALAMHAAHEAGIVHRDLKPQNVLFERDGMPKVTDFGLAKRLDATDGPTLTQEVMGTPAYMAPEQALGKNREVGPATDVYALGAILYTMLTGRPPIQGTSWRETLLMVVDREPVAPSKLQPKIPRDLETIALKCLAKEPRRRYASALVLAEDLRRFLDGKPILARRTPAWERGWKWSRRHPVVATLAALALIASIGAVWSIEHRNQTLRREASEEDQRVDNRRREALVGLLKGQEQIARGELDEARVALARLETTLQTESRLKDLRLGVSDALAEARRRIEVRDLRVADQARLVRFEKLRDVAVFDDARLVGLALGGRSDQARTSARAALSVFGTFGASGNWMMGSMPTSFDEKAREKIASGSYLILMVLAEATARPLPGEDARRQAVEALGLLDRASALRPPTLTYRMRRSACLERAGDLEAARLERLEADQMEPTGAFDRLLLGMQLYRDGKPAEAIRQFSLAIQEEPDLFWAQCLTAICSMNTSPPRPSQAWSALNACLQQKPDYAWLYLLRGSASGELGARDFAAAREAEAEAHFAGAEDDFRKAMGMGLDAGLRYALFTNRGVMRLQGGQTEGAITDLQEAIALDPSPSNAHLALAKAFARMGRRADAIGQLDRAIEVKPDLCFLYRERAALRGEASPADIDATLRDLDEAIRRDPARGREVALDHAHRGRLLLVLLRPDEALAACDAALAIAPDLASANRERVRALLRLERYDEAIGPCDVALKNGLPSAEIYVLRGLAKVGQNNFAGAIDDYTHALVLRPDEAQTLRYRGLAYYFANSPELSLRDFEEAVRLEPDNAEGYSGRAAAKVRLRRHREAALDAEESLRRAEPTPPRLYDAARTYAQATAVAAAEVVRRGRPALRESLAYEARAAELLARALDETPAADRMSFWRKIVEPDETMAKLRKRADLARRARAAPTP